MERRIVFRITLVALVAGLVGGRFSPDRMSKPVEG